MRRASPLALALLLAACSDGEAPVVKGADRIGCALAGSAEFVRNCVVERVRRGDDMMLVVHHPDGGFRRFVVLKDGHGLAVADGSHDAASAISNGFLEIRVGRDRYRFPFTPTGKGNAKPQAGADQSVACAPHGARSYAQTCHYERAGETLVLYHPDGGFRRFSVKGERIAAADGADPAEVDPSVDEVALSVGDDSYLIPQALLADARK